MKAVDLYCIPYAGGSAEFTYTRLKTILPQNVEVKPLELAGRGMRISEKFFMSIDEVVIDFMRAFHNRDEEKPYAIYAHSMGTVVAYELIKAIKKEGISEPICLFLSGRQPPHHRYNRRDIHDLPDDEFIEDIEELGGDVKKIFQDEEMRRIFLPILKSDYKLIEEYKFSGEYEKIKGDIVIFYSDDDVLVKDKNSLQEWRRYTDGHLELHEFRGGHFFIMDNWNKICAVISKTLGMCII